MKQLNNYITEQINDKNQKIDLSTKLSELKFEEIKNIKELYDIVSKSNKKTNKGF